ncbi:MAG: hypothetical protein HOI80_02925 [Alphaproteobacteria bacterium]|jgi:DNA polymerase III subunit delta|nr:hypothetical protein [Alphaproteobacteria bacterium]MBT5389577.1 hypothetical protein [Alphaproteobacteria bacterium]MBT5541018.1 hypothetical protein [Alphaproteobacteria bacterium]MBT5654436.1 hypothetical protein [Alphaproteobacteria bacterium]
MRLSFLGLKRNPKLVKSILFHGSDPEIVAFYIKEYLSFSSTEPCAEEIPAAHVKSDPEGFITKLSMPSLFSNQVPILIKGATDSLTKTLSDPLSKIPEGQLVLLESSYLRATSSLRKLFESESFLGALTCFELDRPYVIDKIQSFNLNLPQEATNFLVERFIQAPFLMRMELEKLSLYKSENPLSIQELFPTNESTYEDLIDAYLKKNIKQFYKAYDALPTGNSDSIPVLRVLSASLMRLIQAHSQVSKGDSIDQALRTLTPPLRLNQKRSFPYYIKSWTTPQLTAAIETINRLEQSAKSTSHSPPQTIKSLERLLC